jgi:flavin reductase (NADH)
MTELPTKSPLAAGQVATAERFRGMMAMFPTGVAVVTTTDDDGLPRGMTCSSVCSVTLRPPTLLVCLRCGSPTLAAVRRNGTFAVNLLHDEARATAELFASGAPDRFDRITWDIGTDSGVPHLVRDAHSIADCQVVRADAVGDHMIVVGEAIRIRHGAGSVPLLYGMRQYRTWEQT